MMWSTTAILCFIVCVWTHHLTKHLFQLYGVVFGVFVKWKLQKTTFTILMALAILVISLLFNHLNISFGSESSDLQHLKDTIEESFRCRDNPGMVIAVVKDGKTIFSEGYGVVLPGSNISVTTNTRFMISSLTKGLTAALMVNVFANNPRNKNYSLSTPLREIVGDGFAFADEERTKYASAEDLLSHRIGLPNKGFMRLQPGFNRADFLNFAKYWKSSLTFRGQAKYSSVTYTLAAAITELVGGKPWEELLTERIIKPLGLNSTSFAFTSDFHADDIAKPYSIYKGRQGPISPEFPRVWNSRCGSGCIIATADDMTKWMNFLLSGGQNTLDEQVLPVEEMTTLTKVRTYLKSYRRDIIIKPTFPATSVANNYALAWRQGIYRGYRVISHTGSSPGYSSMIMMYPTENMGIYVAMNGDDDMFYYRMAIVHLISDYLLGFPAWLNASTLCSFPLPWKEPNVRPTNLYETELGPTLPYIQYIGVYKSSLYGELFINFNSSTSVLQGLYGVGSWELYPKRVQNTFHGKGIWTTDFWDIVDWEFQTAENDPKNITRVIVHGFDIGDPPVFQKEFD